jgi:hypothetical protein
MLCYHMLCASILESVIPTIKLRVVSARCIRNLISLRLSLCTNLQTVVLVWCSFTLPSVPETVVTEDVSSLVWYW